LYQENGATVNSSSCIVFSACILEAVHGNADNVCYTFCMNSRGGAVAQLVFVDLLGSVAWFPVWWYTTGLVRVITRAGAGLTYRSRQYGLKIWLANFFVPMYGQYDLTGRLVSVFMRFVVLVGRLIALCAEAIGWGVLIALWVAAPVTFLVLAISSLIQGVIH
jgi:hypothetical protein